MERVVSNALIDFIEAYHTKRGNFPRRSEIVGAAAIAATDKISPEELDGFFESEETLKSLDERGINPPWILDKNPVGLTKEQLAVAAALNNIADTRSDAKKLRDLGISNRKYAGWKHNNVFAQYLTESANNLALHAEHEAHASLIRSMRNGNVAAAKLYFEMTGRWNPAHENTINTQELMQRVIEAIQRHVTDTDTLLKLGAEFQMIATQMNAASNQQGIQAGSNRAALPPVETHYDSEKEFSNPKGALYY